MSKQERRTLLADKQEKKKRKNQMIERKYGKSAEAQMEKILMDARVILGLVIFEN